MVSDGRRTHFNFLTCFIDSQMLSAACNQKLREVFTSCDLFQLKLFSFLHEYNDKISPTYFHDFRASFPSVHQHYTRQACKKGIFLSEEILCSMVLGQGALAMQNPGTPFLLALQNPHLFQIFAKQWKSNLLLQTIKSSKQNVLSWTSTLPFDLPTECLYAINTNIQLILK